MTYTILSFCGGGIRGLLSARLLQRLWSEVDQAIGAQPSADLLAGCSTGASIVSSLVAGKDPTAIVDDYAVHAASFLSRQDTNPQLPAYDVDTLLATQIALHRNPQDPAKSNPKLSLLDQKVLFLAFGVGSQTTPTAPLLLTNITAPDRSPLPGTRSDIGIAQAVVGSGSMPGQFGSVDAIVDGGFLDHDPTIAAVALAIAAGTSLEEIYVVDFGTGLMPQWIASDTAKWGAGQWMNGDGNPNSNTPAMLVNGGVSPVLNLLFNGPSTNTSSIQCGLLLGDNYVYLNASLDRFIPENDVNPADLRYLQDQADRVDLSAAIDLVNKNWPAATS